MLAPAYAYALLHCEDIEGNNENDVIQQNCFAKVAFFREAELLHVHVSEDLPCIMVNGKWCEAGVLSALTAFGTLSGLVFERRSRPCGF